MTNPNDIIDAYNELRRLADILGTDTVEQLLDRITTERTIIDDGIKPPASLHIVGEVPTVGKVVNVSTDSTGLVVDMELNEHGIEVAKAIGILGEDTTAAGIDSRGCPWCTADVRPRLLWRHLNSAHREDLHELYAEDGTKGLQDTFGIAYQTAYGWGQRITGEAA